MLSYSKFRKLKTPTLLTETSQTMYTILSNIKSNVTKFKACSSKTLAHITGKKSCKKAFNTLPIIAFKKGTSLKQTIGTNTIHNYQKTYKN